MFTVEGQGWELNFIWKGLEGYLVGKQGYGVCLKMVFS